MIHILIVSRLIIRPIFLIIRLLSVLSVLLSVLSTQLFVIYPLFAPWLSCWCSIKPALGPASAVKCWHLAVYWRGKYTFLITDTLRNTRVKTVYLSDSKLHTWLNMSHMCSLCWELSHSVVLYVLKIAFLFCNSQLAEGIPKPCGNINFVYNKVVYSTRPIKTFFIMPGTQSEKV